MVGKSARSRSAKRPNFLKLAVGKSAGRQIGALPAQSRATVGTQVTTSVLSPTVRPQDDWLKTFDKTVYPV